MPEDNFAFLLPVVMTIFGAAFLFTARHGMRESLFWGLGFICCASGFTAPHVLSALPVTVTAVVADAFFTIGFFCYGSALVARFSPGAMLRLRITLAVLLHSLIVYAVVGMGSLRAELITSDITCAAQMALAIGICFRKARGKADYLLLGVCGFILAETLLRTTLFSLSTVSDNLESYISSDYAFITQTVSTVGALLLALSALLAVTTDVIARYRDAAERDGLTGLLNRRGLDEAIKTLASAGHNHIAVISCDIDHFKQINYTWGHAGGDRVLQGVGAIMTGIFPTGSHIARVGGEEFIALIPGQQMDVAMDLANVMRLAIAGHDWRSIDIDRRITASFGIDSVGPGDHTIHDAIGRADMALYAAKNSGRNRVATNAQAMRENPGQSAPVLRHG